MSSIARCSNVETSAFIITLTTFACVLSTYRKVTSIEQVVPLAIGGTAVTVTAQVIAFKFFKALDSQKESLVFSYLKSPSFTATLACLIVENKNLFSFERISQIGLVVIGAYICKETVGIVSPFISRPLPTPPIEYTPEATAINFQKAFGDKTLSGVEAVKIGNHYVLNDKEVEQALSDQEQRVRIASDVYKDLERSSPYNGFKWKNYDSTVRIDNSSRSIEAGGFTAGVCESIGSFRIAMEDRTLVAEIEVAGVKLPLFAVFDGHARTNEAARHIETNLPTRLKEKLEFFLESSGSTALTDTVIYNAFKSALVTLHEQYEGDGGTTANVIIIHNKHLYTANVGDSRSAVITERTGKVQILSEDAKPNDPRHQQIIEALGGSVKQSKNGTWRTSSSLAMGSSLGNRDRIGVNPTVDITKTPLVAGSLVVIASDGVWDVIIPSQLGKALHSSHHKARTSVQEIAEDIVHSALMNHSMDNLSAVVIRIPPAKGSGWFGFG
jgi:serine/threonine protein phosphatase PrpC